MNEFNGLGMHMGNLSRLSTAKSRSVSPENFSGGKGRGGMASDGTGKEFARDLGRGWKISPSVRIKPGEVFVLADIEGSGAVQQIWMTPTGDWRHLVLRIRWDNQEKLSVECPLGDFFTCGWTEPALVSSLAVCVNPLNGLNCYWEMPFRKHAEITLTNTNEEVYTIVDGLKGWGQYAGMHQVIKPDGHRTSQQRFGLYRWHIPDPVRFEENLKVTIQALGWRKDRRYLPLQDDIASVAYWYQTLPPSDFPVFPERDSLEVI